MNKSTNPSTQKSETTELLLEKNEHAWTFLINRPLKRNALSASMVHDISLALEAARLAKTEVIVFRGKGPNFCSGFDLSDYQQATEGDLLLRIIRIELLLQQIATYPGLTIALAHGKNYGAGVDLMAVCNQRYATPDATFRMPGLKFGLVLGTRRFKDIVGSSAALSILGNVRTFGAKDGLSINFLHQLAAVDSWESIVSSSVVQAKTLDYSTRKMLHDALRDDQFDKDLALLVRSASKSRLKEKIASYLADL